MNPRYAKYVHMISSHAPSTTRTTLQIVKSAFGPMSTALVYYIECFLENQEDFKKKLKIFKSRVKVGEVWKFSGDNPCTVKQNVIK